MAEKTMKRGKGRPNSSENPVGREALIEAARTLLQELPPAQVSIAAIAREAGVDPALVRYYFGSREGLLLELVQTIEGAPHPPADDKPPVELVEAYVHRAFRVTRGAKHMQRLMIEELGAAESSEVRDKLRQWNLDAIQYLRDVQAADAKDELAAFDVLFAHLAIVGMSDFFASAAPLVEMLAPPGTDMKALGERYEAFTAKLVLDGLRRR